MDASYPTADGVRGSLRPNIKIALADPVSLPIELLYFNGVAHGRVNNLYWSTASENNNDYFNIEKSSDDEIWVDIDKQKGAGNSSTQLYYSFSDNNVVEISNFDGIQHKSVSEVFRILETQWKSYENIVADIFDHLLASLKTFDLELFELPSNLKV